MEGLFHIPAGQSGSPAGVIVLAQAEEHPVLAAPGEVTVATEEPAEHGVFPPFDSTTFASQLLWLAITFVLLYWLVGRVIIPRIGGILEDRRDRIAADLDHAERLRQQSDDAISGYESALAEARAGAFTIAAEARDKAKAEAEARQAAVEADLDQRLAAAERRIEEIKQKALADVGEIAAEATGEIVATLLGAPAKRSEVDAAVVAARGPEAVNA